MQKECTIETKSVCISIRDYDDFHSDEKEVRDLFYQKYGIYLRRGELFKVCLRISKSVLENDAFNIERDHDFKDHY